MLSHDCSPPTLERATYCGPLANPRCSRWLERFPLHSRLWVLVYPELGDEVAESEPLAALRFEGWRARLWSTLPASTRVDWIEHHRQAWGL